MEELTDENFEVLANAISGPDIMKLTEGDLAGSAKMFTKKLVRHPKLLKVMLKYLR